MRYTTPLVLHANSAVPPLQRKRSLVTELVKTVEVLSWSLHNIHFPHPFRSVPIDMGSGLEAHPDRLSISMLIYTVMVRVRDDLNATIQKHKTSKRNIQI